jgi:hypothetical protein
MSFLAKVAREVRAFPPRTLQRLRLLKARVDPDRCADRPRTSPQHRYLARCSRPSHAQPPRLRGRRLDRAAEHRLRHQTPGAQNRIDAAARAARRSPDDIRRAIQPVGAVTDRPHTTERPQAGPGNQPIRATPDAWARIIAGFVHQGRFDTINFVLETESDEQITRFATKVIPAARAVITSGWRG